MVDYAFNAIEWHKDGIVKLETWVDNNISECLQGLHIVSC